MNERNLRYIRTSNSSESTSLADNKLKTKHFLSSRGIPFAKTYVTLCNPQDIKNFSFSSIPSHDFVIKPNRGSQGKGILIVQKKYGTYWIQGEEWTEDELLLHMTDIVHGSFSLQGSSDSVVIEELLIPGKSFSHYCIYGLADIRIIVFNLVPITAMIRMPTEFSGGKANLAQGGIGIGLNIGDGTVVSLLRERKSYTKVFPLEYISLQNERVPFWDDILLFSSQIQMHTGLGYLALDWVITNDGPKLLEINARAGLEIQNVNLVPLSHRLRKIADLKVANPEKGVEIAKALFHSKVINSLNGKRILPIEQSGAINGKDVLVCCNHNLKQTTVSNDIVDIETTNAPLSLITNSGIQIMLDGYLRDNNRPTTVTLGQDILKNFLLDPSNKKFENSNEKSTMWSKEITKLDEEVYEVGKKLNLSSVLKPVNYFSMLDAFMYNRYEFNPTFEYHFLEEGHIQRIQDCIGKLKEKIHKLSKTDQDIASLYFEKIAELETKILLMKAYKKQDFGNISKYNDVLFGKNDIQLLEIAKEKTFNRMLREIKIDKILGRVLSIEEIVQKIEEYLTSKRIPKIPINIVSSNLSRISIAYGREIKIRISRNANIRENEMEAIMAHEIGTHLRRYTAGKNTGLKLFQYGTGYYLADEEGLAIFKSFECLPDGYDKDAMYVKYHLLSSVDTLSFSNTTKYLSSIYPNKPVESIFSDAVRLKRGIIHTETNGIPGAIYAKDKIYLNGYTRVSSWIADGGNPEELFYGKIKISDLKVIRTF